MCTCTTTTRSGQPYPLVWLNGGAHYRQVKGWLRLKLSALVLRQCLIMGSLSDNSPHTSAERVSLIVLFVSLMPPICRRVDVMSVVMFSSGTVHRHKLDGPLLCLRLSDITKLERERLSRAERKRRWEDEETRQTDTVFSLFTALWYRQSRTTSATGDPTIRQGDSWCPNSFSATVNTYIYIYIYIYKGNSGGTN